MRNILESNPSFAIQKLFFSWDYCYPILPILTKIAKFYKAMADSSMQQTETYTECAKIATESLEFFVSNIDKSQCLELINSFSGSLVEFLFFFITQKDRRKEEKEEFFCEEQTCNDSKRLFKIFLGKCLNFEENPNEKVDELSKNLSDIWSKNQDTSYLGLKGFSFFILSSFLRI